MKNETQSPWLIVTMREMAVKVKDKAFWLGTISTLVLVIGSMVIGGLLSNQGQTTTVAVTDQPSHQLAEQVKAVLAENSAGLDEVEIVQADSPDQARQLVSDSEAEVYLAPRLAGGWQTTYQDSPNHSFEAALETVLDQQMTQDLAASSGVELAEVSKDYSVTVDVIDPPEVGKAIAWVASLIFAILFFMSATIYGMQIATSVIEEKQSRIVEILVSAIPVSHLLTGKVLGNTILAVAQIALLFGAGLIGVQFLDVALPIGLIGSAATWFIVFFLAGFLALACVWAAAGAMCTRSEDLNQTSQPLMWVLLLAYLAGFMATGTARTVLSYVPIVSSILMPARIIEGAAAWWEPLIALLLNLAFAGVTIYFGSMIYRRALLQTSGRLSFGQALKLTRKNS